MQFSCVRSGDADGRTGAGDGRAGRSDAAGRLPVGGGGAGRADRRSVDVALVVDDGRRRRPRPADVSRRRRRPVDAGGRGGAAVPGAERRVRPPLRPVRRLRHHAARRARPAAALLVLRNDAGPSRDAVPVAAQHSRFFFIASLKQ